MRPWLIYTMIFSGAALMIYNIYGFIRFSRGIKRQKSWKGSNWLLNLPIALLVGFFLGYVAVGLFGQPDWIIGGILFGGSIFVFVMYKMLSGTLREIIEGERREAKLLADDESSRVKTSFLSTVSHEMRTPMNVIIGMDTIALREPELPPQTRLCLERIGLSARHLLGLINNILDINRIESGHFVIQRKPFALREEISQAVGIAQALCEEKKLAFRLYGEEHLNGRYLGDAMVIKQVLLELLDNAVKYTDCPGSVILSVSAESAGTGRQRVTLAVKDTGVGMDPEFVQKIFNVFTREDDTNTSRFGGTGLGLGLARRLVELMGGEISVTSRKNVGSTFTVSLPLEETDEALEEVPSLVPEPVREEVSLEGRRVLIVEDIDENAEIAADLLELEGVESERAENGQIGLEKVEKAPPGYYDAVLMDIRMPVMDGLEATRRIRALPRPDIQRLPIIALSANAFEEDVKNTLEAGMNAHLAKPADADQLYDTLRMFIAKRDKEEANA